jgi:hypothetical protein
VETYLRHVSRPFGDGSQKRHTISERLVVEEQIVLFSNPRISKFILYRLSLVQQSTSHPKDSYTYAAIAAMIPATPARPHAWTGPAAPDLAVEEAEVAAEVAEPPDEEPVEVAEEPAVDPAADEPAADEPAAEDEADEAAAADDEEAAAVLEEEPKADAEPRIPPWTWLGGELPLVPLAADW